MPPVNYLPGTKSAHTPSECTDAQYKALESVKQKTPRLKFGAARPEFMNKVMLADGSISDDLAAVRNATQAAQAADRAELAAFIEANQSAILHDSLSPKDKATLLRLRSAAAHQLVDELEEHLAQQRFLFIVDASLVPRIYFQCAVPENPDVELADDEIAE